MSYSQQCLDDLKNPLVALLEKCLETYLKEIHFGCNCIEYSEATDDELRARANFYTESSANVRQAKLQHNKLSGSLTIL